MIGLDELAARGGFDERPWLMIGKGPSFSELKRLDTSQYQLLSLNHAVREQKVDIAHVIDIDVIQDCEDVLVDNCRYLVMPRYPHVRCRLGQARLEDYSRGSAALRRLDSENRLVWYNLSSAARVGDSPSIRVRFFSSEAALGVLGHLGARTVRSVGIDGGSTYANAFAGLTGTTLLANGHPSFDVQFAHMREICRSFGMDYRPIIEPLRVFVGASPDEVVPYRVLAHSIHRHASIPVTVESLGDVRVRMPVRREARPRTPFSFNRFAIPDLCDHRGRALYVDSDMLVFSDVAELLEYDLGDAAIACTSQPAPEAWQDNAWFKPGRQFSVMLLDCSKLPWTTDSVVDGLDRGDFTYEELMFEMCLVDPSQIDDSLDPGWNSLEHYEPASTKLLHFTVVPTQPWRSRSNPLGEVWWQEYEIAVRNGAIPRDEVEALVGNGGRPELLDAFDACATSEPPPARNVAEVALDHAFLEMDRLQQQTLAGMARSASRPLRPTIRRLREGRYGHRVSPILESLLRRLERRPKSG